MTKPAYVISVWQRLCRLPAGKWLFSRIICWKAPYFASISPRFVELRPGYCEIRFRKRRKVLNHIRTVHAIAMCNVAELAAGTMSEATVPAHIRWIPKGMTVEYLKRAETDVVAMAALDPLPEFLPETELPVTVTVTDTNHQTVFRAVITMWLSAKKS